MNILTRTVIALTAEEQQTLKNAASILFDLASAIEDRGGNDTGYNIRGMASDLENFVEDNSEIVCEEGGGIMVGFALCYAISCIIFGLYDSERFDWFAWFFYLWAIPFAPLLLP